MPWSGESFAKKHNHSLHGEAANHGARQANAILRSGASEGTAIATANKWAGQHRADGGYTMPTRSPERERAGELLSRGRVQSPQTDLNLTPVPPYGAPGGPLDTKQGIDWLPQHMDPDTTKIEGPPHPGGYRTANGGIVPRYDDGGATDPSIGGPTPAQTANPMAQGLVQRYSSLPTEKLQELAARLGGTPQAGMIQSLLRQRQMMPQTAPQPQQAPQQQPAQPGQGYRRGGAPKRDVGGMMGMSEAEPWWSRSEARGADSGLLHGTTPGQADAIKTSAPAGSFVVPAEVVAHLGQGNTLAGSRVMEAILNSGPGGMPMPRAVRGSGPPRPPQVSRTQEEGGFKEGGPVQVFEAKARGGEKQKPGETPVDLSDGEYVIAPHHVTAWGGGDHERGVRILNRWVMAKHKEHLATLKRYKGPVGARKEDKK